MAELNISEYLISLWNTKLVSNTELGSLINYIEELKVCNLGDSNYFLPSDAINPCLTLKNNGEILFSFDLYTNYWDIDELKQIENPYLSLLNAECRIKLYYHNEWYDFIIIELSHTNKNKNKLVHVECTNAFSTELGKSGYDIEFSTDLENNLNTVFNLANAVVENSDWKILDNEGHIVGTQTIPLDISAKSDIIKEIQNEYLYRVKLNRIIKANLYFTDAETDISGYIYVFASCLNNGNQPYTFLKLTDNEIIQYSLQNELILNNDVWRITTNFLVDEEPDTNGWYIPYILEDGEKKYLFDKDSIALSTKLRARRFIASEITQYNNILELYTKFYKFEYSGTKPDGYPSNWTLGDLIQGYTKTEYLTTDTNRNLISNASNFLSNSGWNSIKVSTSGSATISKDVTISPLYYPKIDPAKSYNAYASLRLEFNTINGWYYNSGFTDSKSFIGEEGLSINETYVFKLKAYTWDGDINKESVLIKPDQNTRCPLGVQLRQYQISDNVYEFINLPLLNFIDSSSNPLTWYIGYEYELLTSPDIYTGDFYILDDTTGIYGKIDKPNPIDPAKNYYKLSDLYYYTILSVQHGSYSYDTLFNSSDKYGFFIKTSDASTPYYIRDFEIFKYAPKIDGTPYLPEDAKPVEIKTIYKYFKPNANWTTADEIEYLSTDEPDTHLKLLYNSSCAKSRSITSSKSNRYNLLSLICDTFECWMRFHIARNDDGSIKLETRETYDLLTTAEIESINLLIQSGMTSINYYTYNTSLLTYEPFNPNEYHYIPITEDEKASINKIASGSATVIGTYWYWDQEATPPGWRSRQVFRGLLLLSNTQYYEFRKGLDIHKSYYNKKLIKALRKYITFHSSIGKPRYTGFIYGLNTTSITRTVKSDNIVTKLLVEENHNEYAENGYCSISDALSNTSGETYIYNFSHYINRNLIDAKLITYDLNKLNQDMNKYNKLIKILSNLLILAGTLVNTLSALRSIYESAYVESSSEIDELDSKLLALSKLTYAYWTLSTARRKELLESKNTNAITAFETLERLTISNLQYKILFNNYDSLYISWVNKLKALLSSLNDFSLSKKKCMYAFELKYRAYIREGTWESENYDNAETYFLDACNTSNNSAYPKVSYSLLVADLSGIEEYSNYIFDIGDRTYILDTEMFGYYSDGITPLRKDVAITLIKYNLTKPSENTITITTFKDEFNDLFQKFAAATQKLEYNEAAYDLTASAISTTFGINLDILQETFDSNNIVVGNSGSQGVEIDSTGIKLTSINSPNNIVKILGLGIFFTNDGGKKWISGLTANGFNTTIFKSGAIYTSKMNILDDNGSNVFGWTKEGISAYSIMSGGGVDLGKFIRFDRFGIYGYSGSIGDIFSPTSELDIINSASIPFSLTWSGFRLKTKHGDGSNAGGISITSNNDFLVFEGDIERIKIGCLNPLESTNYKYGMRISGTGGSPMLYANDDGSMWLATKMLVGGTLQEYAIAEFGSGEKFSGWIRESDIKSKPLYPLPAAEGSSNFFLRILNIKDRLVSGYLINCTTATTFEAKQLLNRHEASSQISENTPIYIIEECLLNASSELLFYLTPNPSTSDIEYLVYVSYGTEKIRDTNYYIPKINGSNLITNSGLRGASCLYYRYGFKFEIYDDGTVRAPRFCIDSNGNLFMNYETSLTLISPIIKASEHDSLTEMTVRSWGFRVNSMEAGTESLRLEMGVTQNGSVAINPYIYFIPNQQLADENDPEKLKYHGLVKMFNNQFMWIGNAVLKSSPDFILSDNDNRGILFSFNGYDGDNGGLPVAYIINGEDRVEIATRNATAVFG